MKKIFNSGYSHASKLMCSLKMKLFLLCLFTMTLAMNANSTYAQRTKITIDKEQATIIEIIDEIESQTDFSFFFNTKVIDLERKVTVKFERTTVDKLLEYILQSSNTKFEIQDRKIFLTKKAQESSVKKSESYNSLKPALQLQIQGTIYDESNIPLPGANIVEKGTSNGVVSDFDGKYSIEVDDENAILVVSYIGYSTKEIAVNGQSNIDIVLSESAAGLEEVVLVGYGSLKRKDLTGSVSSVELDNIQDLPVSRIDQALIGKVAGMQVTPITGEPGAAPRIIIRGVGSISAGSNPLFVVDGFPTEDIQSLNPDDIESIDILKDASATAIYGSRGANGVIIINTKRGKAGESVISFDSFIGWQKVEKIPEMMNARQQAQYHYDGLRNRNLDEGNPVDGPPTEWVRSVPIDVLDVLEGRNTYDVDALDVVLRSAVQQQYQLSASGGNENTRYAISGEYFTQDGLVVNSDFERTSFRANLDAKLANKLTARVNLNPSYTNRNALSTTGNQGTGILGSAMATHNYYPLIDENGEYTFFGGLGAIANFLNPLAVAKEYSNNNKAFRFLGNIELTYSILDELQLKTLLGANIYNNQNVAFQPQLPVFFNNPAFGSDSSFSSFNWLSETTLNYNKFFDKHSITGLVGFTAQKEDGHVNYLESNRFPNNLVKSLSAVGGQITDGYSEEYSWSLLSYLARLNYNYDSKYYVTTSIRTDGSSRFGANKKYGVFPSIALAWRASQENFLKDSEFLNELKFRMSYGQTGNNNIGNFQQFATTEFLTYPLGGSAVGGYAPERLPNPNLTWEKQESVNLGIDVGVIDNRISFSLDHFRSRSKDLLLNVNIPSITGFTNTLQNIGEVHNTGWELVVSTKNFDDKFKWSTNFNVSTSKNEVVKLGPEGDPIFADNNITQIGQPIGMFYGLLTDGIFKNQQELDNGPIYNPGANDESRLGDIRFKDVSGPDGVPDGIINTFDNTIMGSPYPDFFYGMSNNFSYKNFNLSVDIQGVKGNRIYNNSRGAGNSTRSRVRGYAFNVNNWMSPEQPGDGVTPRPNDAPTGGVRVPSQRYLDTGSYLRINNITLSYLLTDKSLPGIKSIRMYLNATNPFLITNNTAFNPDANFYTDPLRPGNEWNDYPLAKGITLGFNFTF